MSTISSRFDTVARVLPGQTEAPVDAFSARLSGLYALSQKSNYVFASPLGPVGRVPLTLRLAQCGWGHPAYT